MMDQKNVPLLPGDSGAGPAPLPASETLRNATPVRRALPPELQAAEHRFQAQLDADPDEALAEYQRRFGHVLDRDNARELFSEYAASPASRQALGAATYRPAGTLVDRLYRQEAARNDPIAGNVVVFNAGGPGVGKTTGVTGESLPVQIVMDGTLTNLVQSRAYMQLALDRAKTVCIHYTQRPYEETLQKITARAIDPEKGRIATAEMAAVGRRLARENVLTLAGEFASHPRFRIILADVGGDCYRPMMLEELRAQTPERLDDLQGRAVRFINGYFHEHAANTPALTESLRQRLLGKFDRCVDGPTASEDRH